MNVKGKGLNTPLPLGNKDVQIVLWKKTIKKQNSAKGSSDYQCKFLFVFGMKMVITLFMTV